MIQDDSTDPSKSMSPSIALTHLRQGESGRLMAADLRPADQEFLTALGFAPHSLFRLCQAGDPWIVQVRGTRIGLSEQVAKNLLVVRSEA